MPVGMEHTWKVWYDRELDLLILRREENVYEDSTFTFSWDGGITFEPGPAIYNSTFEVTLFPGESVFASAWSRDTLSTWEIGANIGLPSGGSTFNMICSAWEPGESMEIFYNTAQDTHFVYHGWDYSDYFTLEAVTTDIPGCIYLTRGYSSGEMYSIYGDYIYRTTDYGESWEWACDLCYQHTLPLDVYLESGWAPGELILMYHYNDLFEYWAEIYRSTDYGSTWQILYDREDLSVDAGNISPIPSSFELSVYPNPANPSFTIDYTLDKIHPVELGIYNMLGQLVWIYSPGTQVPGNYKLNYSGEGLSSGMYFLRIQSESKSISKTITILK